MPSTAQPQDDFHSDIAASIFALAPHPNNYMMKFLSDANGDQLPILGEYLGVALAFAALGALIRENTGIPDAKLSPKLQRLGLQVMLKSAMDRLQVLALNAQDLEEKVKEGKESTCRDADAWEFERSALEQKLSVAEAQIADVEKSRQEDARTSRVMGIFSSHEQSWKIEKNQLNREIKLLKDEIVSLRDGNLLGSGDGEKEYEECKEKSKELEKLGEKQSEKEFLMTAAMDESRADQHDCIQISGKLAMLELCVSDLKGKLSKEMARNAELQEVIADVKRKHEEAEINLMCAKSDHDRARSEIESISAAKLNQNAIIEELLESLTCLQKEVNDKEEVIAVLMKRTNTDRREKEELLRELSHAKAKRKSADTEKDRWKRLAEERARIVPAGRDAHKGKRKSGSKPELDKLAEMQRIHNEEFHGLRSMYMTKLESLQGQLQNYEMKVAALEERVRSAQDQKRKSKHEERSSAGNNAVENVKFHELVTLLESVAPDEDVMHRDGVDSEIQEVPMTVLALKEWIKKWLEAVKRHHTQHLEKWHRREIDAFERQTRLKDERLESFRRQLLNMESEISKLRSELPILRSKLAEAVDEKGRAESAVELKEKELRALMKTMLQNSEAVSSPDSGLDTLSYHEAQQKVLILLQKDLNDAKKKLDEIELEHQRNLSKVAEDYEAELKQKDLQVAVLEAKLCQIRIQIDNEKRLSPKRTPEASPQEDVPDKVYKIAVIGAQEMDIKNAISTACCEVEKLADKIAEVRKQMMESDEYDSGLEELMDQATAVSNSGKKLSLLRNAISVEELNNTKITLFKDHQTTSSQLEAVSEALQELPSDNLAPAMEQDILEQPAVHTEGASTSGIYSGAQWGGMSEECITSALDTEPEVNSRRAQDGYVILHNQTVSNSEHIIEEGETICTGASSLSTESSRKRERRKTLKEYFLDSPPELVVSNEIQVLPVDLTQSEKKDALSFSSQDVPQIRKKKPLSVITPSQENIAAQNLATPSKAATPLFDRIKSRRREFNKTREDIQVLGLALEVRKIEEQIFLIDKRCASPATPKISPKRHNKRYTTLTGKVGQLAKQMGLTSEKTPEVVTDNPLFNKRPPTSELLSLQQRAEAVTRSLASIEAQVAISPVDASSTVQHTGYSKERLVDTVKTHLTQVQRSLNSRLAPLTSRQPSFIQTVSTPLKERM